MLDSHRAPWRSRRAPDQALAIANLALASAQPLAAYVTKLTGRGVSEAERASAVDGPVSPVPGTFVIWLPLFATSIGYGARIARVRDRRVPPGSVAWLMSAAYSCNTVWSLQAQLRGLGWPSVAIILAAAGSASAALIGAERLAASSREASPRGAATEAARREARVPEVASPETSSLERSVRADLSNEARAAAHAIAPLAGWLTLAAFANIEATLNETGRRPRRREEARRALALLGGAQVAAAAIASASRGSPLYTAAVAWGLGGVVLRNLRAQNRVVAVAAGIGACAAVAGTLFGRRWFGARRVNP